MPEMLRHKDLKDNLMYYSILYAMERMEYEQINVPVDLDTIDYIDRYQFWWLIKQTLTDYDESSNPQDFIIARCIERVVLEAIEHKAISKDSELPF